MNVLVGGAPESLRRSEALVEQANRRFCYRTELLIVKGVMKIEILESRWQTV